MGSTNEISVNELVNLAKNKQFPKKRFRFGRIVKQFTPVLNFFTCQTVFENKPTEKLEFICKVKISNHFFFN